MTELVVAERYRQADPAAPTVALLHGDALDALAWARTHTPAVDLVYMDPPYATGKAFDFVTGPAASSVARAGFDDRVTDVRALVDGLKPVLSEAHAAMAADGSLLLHCDPRSSPYFAIALDEVFGPGERRRGANNAPGFRNELVWEYGLGGSSPRSWPRKHDAILWYSRGSDWFFDAPLVAATSARMRGQMKKHPDVLRVPSINNMATERTGYPTQKPLELLRVLVGAHCRAGGVVVDPFAGSGTTGIAALEMGRACVLADVNADAIAVCRARLLDAGASVVIWRAQHLSVTGAQAEAPERAYFAASGEMTADGVFESSSWRVAGFRTEGLGGQDVSALKASSTGHVRLWTDRRGDVLIQG